MTDTIVEVVHLNKRFGPVTALSDLSVQFPSGTVGLLGPNGAGKTTLLRILLGLMRPDTGRGSILGLDVTRRGRQVRQRIGYMPEDDCLIPQLSAVECVVFCGQLEGLPARAATQRAHQVLDYVGIDQERYRLVDGFSVGMRQRVKMAQALVGAPELLFLDEPTTGLDPAGRAAMLKLISDLARAGINVILSSHLLHDVEAVCRHVVVLAGGRARLSGPLEELSRFDQIAYDLKVRGDLARFAERLACHGLKVLEAHDEHLRVAFAAGRSPDDVVAAAAEVGVQLRGLVPARRTLEEVFLEAVRDSEVRP